MGNLMQVWVSHSAQGERSLGILNLESLCHLLEVTSILIHQTVSLEACAKGNGCKTMVTKISFSSGKL